MSYFALRISELREKQVVVEADTFELAREKLSKAYDQRTVKFDEEATVSETVEIYQEKEDQTWIDEYGPDGYQVIR